MEAKKEEEEEKKGKKVCNLCALQVSFCVALWREKKCKFIVHLLRVEVKKVAPKKEAKKRRREKKSSK